MYNSIKSVIEQIFSLKDVDLLPFLLLCVVGLLFFFVFFKR